MGISTYIAYHIDRLRRWGKREGRQFSRAVQTLELSYMLCYALSILSVFQAVVLFDWQMFRTGLFFGVCGFAIHAISDYRKGYHVGWARRRLKAKAALGARQGRG